MPECSNFLNNFFASYEEDDITALVNYERDVKLYGFDLIKLMTVFEDISGIRIYYG